MPRTPSVDARKAGGLDESRGQRVIGTRRQHGLAARNELAQLAGSRRRVQQTGHCLTLANGQALHRPPRKSPS